MATSIAMEKSRNKFDTTRASRDGHEFHEAWVARKCLGLLLPKDDLVGVAIEGFGGDDQDKVTTEANEIADAVLYYGKRASFEQARSVVVVQVKYSKAAELKPFRAADAKKTLVKFARTYRAYKRQHGTEQAREKLRFELVTNRPILDELTEALRGLISGTVLRGTAKAQATQVKTACKLDGKDLVEFVSRLQFTGLTGNLRETKHQLAMSLADWSPARDPMASVRLNAVRQLARDKAGLANQRRNLISRSDILTALELQDESDLLPCPASFPRVGAIIERQQLAETVARIPQLERPLVIHADGGVGKTVFMNSIAASLASTHEVVLFDCFGMGQYRAPGYARHLPRRGLVHIANDLACRGLCDPLLPTTDNGDDIIRAFRARLNQAAETVRRSRADRQLVLLLDAIDNADEHARDRREDSFPKLLLESIGLGGSIPGVQLVVSARSHRRHAATGGVACEELALSTFTLAETAEFLRPRVKKLTEVSVQVAQSRSRGNARVLEHLVAEGADLLAPSEINKVIELDDLLRERIAGALSEARTHGYRDEDIKTFLAGLATLPPPVPVSEFAEANRLSEGAVRSFAADLASLLEQTKHGLMLRDEPTENLIRRDYSADPATLRALADNLYSMQGKSVYAATTLPDLLQQLGDGEQLFRLAFDERLPAAIKSAAGQQAIRHARLKAAIAHAASQRDLGRLVPLLVEMSTLAAGDQRGTQYLLDHPDLTVVSGDVDSVRRLFEVRTKWPGTRHARLAIAHALTGDLADAYRHAHRVDEWRSHYFDQDDDYRRDNGSPEALDMAAIPFCLLVKNDSVAAARDIAGWVDWFAFEVAEEVFALARLGAAVGVVRQDALSKLMMTRLTPGVLAAAIHFADGDEGQQRSLITTLAEVCAKKPEGLSLGKESYQPQARPIIRGLLLAASVAVVLGMDAEATAILSAIQLPVPSLHTYMDSYWTGDVYPFLARQVLARVAAEAMVDERDLLTVELSDLAQSVPAELRGSEFRRALKAELEKRYQARRVEGAESLDHRTKSSAERFIDSRLDTWLRVALAFAEAIRGMRGGRKGSLTPLVDLWTELRNKQDYYTGGVEAQRQHNAVGERLLTLALGADCTLDTVEVRRYADALSGDGMVAVSSVIEVVGILAVRPAFQALAGTLAVHAKVAIEREDEVDQRASYFSALGRAISPASREESVEYFRRGLEQMDAIGSGDYQFANELMHFASALHGEQLADPYSHTLSNICELNLGEERKFHWAMYGAAMAKASGLKGLAKLARWEDRERISLDYTLLPYLRALLDNDQVDPVIALTMLRVSNPAELYVCGTEQLVESLEGKDGGCLGEWAEVLIVQYLQDNPGSFASDTPRALADLAKRALGEASREYTCLSAVATKNEVTRKEYNDLNNWREPTPIAHVRERQAEQDAALCFVQSLVADLDPVDELAVTKAILSLEERGVGTRLERPLLDLLRPKVAFKDWPTYIRMIARQEPLDLYDKLHELHECKDAWSEASNAVITALRECADVIMQENTFEFIAFEHLSGSQLNDLSALSGVDRQTLIIGLVQEFSRPNTSIPASVWLSLAAEFNRKAASGVGQQALTRLLNSGPAKLASSAADGAWQPDLYPSGEPVDAAAGLIWFALGSPDASRRWMAAHSLRTAVRLGKADVLDQVAARFDWTHAEPFQAKELLFFYSHAQLWFLIALARIAIDAPEAVAGHQALLENIVTDTTDRHVLRNHFAAQALLACAKQGRITLEPAALKALKDVNRSPHSMMTSGDYAGESFYQSRPEAFPAPENELHLEYDFDKYEVSGLSDVFGRSRWETADAIYAWVRRHDTEITYMSDSGARSGYRRDRIQGISDEHHSYGEQLCWHALHAVAGEFLAKYPVVRRPYDQESPWAEWLSRRMLTNTAGFWLADGTDWRPADTRINLREAGEKGVVLTSDPNKLLSLIGIGASIGEWLVVDGDWKAMDSVGVHVQSALVPSSKSVKLATTLAAMDPFQAYLPRLQAYEDADPGSARAHAPYRSWVVTPGGDARLDVADTLGVAGAAHRARLASAANAFGQLTSTDPFHRTWGNPSGDAVVRSEVWVHHIEGREGGRGSGSRMQCRTTLIRDFLSANASDLLLLVILRRFESGHGSRASRYWHTTAVVRVTESLEFTIYPGRANELHEAKF
jgi:hypothetical protein